MISVIVLVCAKLHNLCVDRWIINGRRNNVDILGNRRPSDLEVSQRLNNRHSEISTRAAVSNLRYSMIEKIWDCGLRIASENDLVGLPTIL